MFKQGKNTKGLKHMAGNDVLTIDQLVHQDDWVCDSERYRCHVCTRNFGSFRRKHHCRRVSLQKRTMKEHSIDDSYSVGKLCAGIARCTKKQSCPSLVGRVCACACLAFCRPMDKKILNLHHQKQALHPPRRRMWRRRNG